jgi:hypothetical protein
MSFCAGTIVEFLGLNFPAKAMPHLKSGSMLARMQETEASWSKILTAILGVLGFLISCYNYMRLKRKDAEESRNQIWTARTEFNERRQEAITLMMAVQASVERNRRALEDVSREAERSGRADVVQMLKERLADAEANVSEIDAMLQNVLSSIPPAGTSAEEIRGLMASYDEKVLVGLKMRNARIEEHVKKVDTVVELAEQAIRTK